MLLPLLPHLCQQLVDLLHVLHVLSQGGFIQVAHACCRQLLMDVPLHALLPLQPAAMQRLYPCSRRPGGRKEASGVKSAQLRQGLGAPVLSGVWAAGQQSVLLQGQLAGDQRLLLLLLL